MTNKTPRKPPEIRELSIVKTDLNAKFEDMLTIRKMWTKMKPDADDSLEFYYDKIVEEYDEFVEGEDETPTVDGKVLKTTGDTRFSEGITVINTVLHWMQVKTGLDYTTLIAMVPERFREQAWRYHVIEDVNQDVGNQKYDSFEDGTYWVLRHSRDNRIFGMKLEWTARDGTRLREVVDLTTEYHWNGDRFVLPKSYKPYMDVQKYTFLNDKVGVRGIEMPDGWLAEFFSPRGVELLDEPRDGIYVKVKDVSWFKPILGDFESMRHP